MLKMKTINVIALIVFCCLNSIHAQETIKKNKVYRTWITMNSEPFKVKGFLYEINDSSISVANSKIIKEYSTVRFQVAKLHIIDIEKIKTRRNNSIGRGIWIGAVTGFVVGGIIGLVDGDDPAGFLAMTAGEKAIKAGVALSIGGAVIGGLIGTIKIRIPIDGSMNNYNRNKNKLNKYSIKK